MMPIKLAPKKKNVSFKNYSTTGLNFIVLIEPRYDLFES